VRNPVILHLERPMIMLCFLERPIDFGALDGEKVNTLFTLISPTVRAHLHLLSREFALRDRSSCASCSRAREESGGGGDCERRLDRQRAGAMSDAAAAAPAHRSPRRRGRSSAEQRAGPSSARAHLRRGSRPPRSPARSRAGGRTPRSRRRRLFRFASPMPDSRRARRRPSGFFLLPVFFGGLGRSTPQATLVARPGGRRPRRPPPLLPRPALASLT
jgi:hypothetical protein